MRVLLVEDETRLANAVRRGLEAEGFSVDVAADGKDGFWRASEGRYDAIVLDIMLPGMNGFRVCSALREAGHWTPILMLTAKDGELDEAEGLDTGARSTFPTPGGRSRRCGAWGTASLPMAVSGFISASRSPAGLRAGLRARLRPRRRLRPLRRWFLVSVRARTTALSMLVVAAALAACAISLVVIVSRSLVRNVDETNLTRAEDVAARARAGALGRIIPVSGGAGDRSVFVQVVDQAGSGVAFSEKYVDPIDFIYVYPEEGSHNRVLFHRAVHGLPMAPPSYF